VIFHDKMWFVDKIESLGDMSCCQLV